jgi:hypothetical protein
MAIKSTRQPILAAAKPASQPAWPAPTTMMSYLLFECFIVIDNLFFLPYGFSKVYKGPGKKKQTILLVFLPVLLMRIKGIIAFFFAKGQASGEAYGKTI